MSLQAELIVKIEQLPLHQQFLVRSLVDELARGRSKRQPVNPGNWFGALEHLQIEISENDIAQARHEMWDGFPREVGE